MCWSLFFNKVAGLSALTFFAELSILDLWSLQQSSKSYGHLWKNRNIKLMLQFLPGSMWYYFWFQRCQQQKHIKRKEVTEQIIREKKPWNKASKIGQDRKALIFVSAIFLAVSTNVLFLGDWALGSAFFQHWEFHSNS